MKACDLEEKTNHLQACVAIDLGARYTGTFSILHKSSRLPSKDDCRAATYVLPEDGGKMTYSQRNRTAVRHRIRGKKRFALARRMAMLIIREKLAAKSVTLTSSETRRLAEAVSSLLRRRGYNRLETETDNDLTVLENIEPEVFSEHEILGKYFYAGTDLAIQWETLSQDLSKISSLLAERLSEKDFKKYLTGLIPDDKNKIKHIISVFKMLIDEAESINMQCVLGHKHRTQYLSDIHADMHRDTRLSKAAEAFGGVDRLWRLLGNLSNLQLRAHRWYFNAPHLFDDQALEPARLQKTLVRAFKYLHCPQGVESRAQAELVKELEEADDIIDALCTIDPVRTIPPYENQQNRRPPFDQTLYLSPDLLDRQFGHTWKSWAVAFAKEEPLLEDGLEVILAQTDRRSRVKALNKNCRDALDYKFSYVLQRVLDRSKACDSFCLRALAAGAEGSRLTVARNELQRVLGTQHVNDFLRLAKLYYRETGEAKNGLWLQEHACVLERADIHPPMKSKIINQLLGAVFGLDADFGRLFKNKIWNRTVSGRSTVRSMCQNIEQTRKAHGGEFNLLFKQATAGAEGVAEDIAKTVAAVGKLREFFSTIPELDECTINRVANPYSLVQLYTLLEVDRSGFSSVSAAAHFENEWRMKTWKDETCSRCSRLPADAVRPFDGVLRRVLDRQTSELSRQIASDFFERISGESAQIDLAIVIEENKFAFSASLADLKKNRAAADKAKDALTRQEKRWLSKSERIKIAARGLCAYTGEALSDAGEFDHIIPRSQTTAAMGTAFNSEANLLFVSQKGNQQKKDGRYFLTDLKDNYLNRIFGTSDRKQISEEIEKTVDELVQSGRIRHFELLNQKQQDCVRHALFLNDASEARQAVLRELSATNRSKVNGTQAWFVRSLVSKLTRITADWRNKHNHTLNIRSCRVNAQAASSIRMALGKLAPDLAKPDIQPVASHSIDAMCAYAAACASVDFCSFVGGNPSHSDPESFTNDNQSNLAALYPDACDVRWVKSSSQKDISAKAIFKEGILAENFLPILVKQDKVYVGFTLPSASGAGGNALPVTGKNPLHLLEVAGPYLDKTPASNSSQTQCCNIVKQKAFALFNKQAQDPDSLTREETEAAALLKHLHYITERIPLSKMLLNDTGNKLLDAAKLKKKIDAQTLSCTIKSKKSQFSVTGTLALPAQVEWARLASDPSLVPHLGESTKTFDLNVWIRSVTHLNAGSKCRHVSVKRIASLPVVSKASGGFRIRRTTATAQEVYQLYNIAGAKCAGFASRNGEVSDWKRPLLKKELVHDNLTPLDVAEYAADESVGLLDFRLVAEENDITVYIAPGTADRRYVRLELPFPTLRNWLTNAEAVAIPDSPLGLPSEIILKKSKAFAPTEPAKVAKLLGTPRSHLFVEQLGSRVRLWYIVESSNSDMSRAFNRAQS